jgi:chromosome partitioning protein
MVALVRSDGQFSSRARTMRTIAVIAQKGGTGKTTISCNLAASAHNAGLRVMIADMDPQGSATDWERSRQIDGPSVLPLKLGSLFPAQYTAENAGVDLMIIDTRASAPADVVAAAKAADLCMVVVRPTVIDLRAIADTVNVLRPLQRPAAFVVNQAPCQRLSKDPVMVLEAIELLASYGMAVAPVGIRARQVYQTAFTRGLSPCEAEPDSLAAGELGRLWGFASERLWPAGFHRAPRKALLADYNAAREAAIHMPPAAAWAGQHAVMAAE